MPRAQQHMFSERMATKNQMFPNVSTRFEKIIFDKYFNKSWSSWQFINSVFSFLPLTLMTCCWKYMPCPPDLTTMHI